MISNILVIIFSLIAIVSVILVIVFFPKTSPSSYGCEKSLFSDECNPQLFCSDTAHNQQCMEYCRSNLNYREIDWCRDMLCKVNSYPYLDSINQQSTYACQCLSSYPVSAETCSVRLCNEPYCLNIYEPNAYSIQNVNTNLYLVAKPFTLSSLPKTGSSTVIDISNIIVSYAPPYNTRLHGETGVPLTERQVRPQWMVSSDQELNDIVYPSKLKENELYQWILKPFKGEIVGYSTWKEYMYTISYVFSPNYVATLQGQDMQLCYFDEFDNSYNVGQSKSLERISWSDFIWVIVPMYFEQSYLIARIYVYNSNLTTWDFNQSLCMKCIENTVEFGVVNGSTTELWKFTSTTFPISPLNRPFGLVNASTQLLIPSLYNNLNRFSLVAYTTKKYYLVFEQVSKGLKTSFKPFPLSHYCPYSISNKNETSFTVTDGMISETIGTNIRAALPLKLQIGISVPSPNQGGELCRTRVVSNIYFYFTGQPGQCYVLIADSINFISSSIGWIKIVDMNGSAKALSTLDFSEATLLTIDSVT